MEIYSQNIAVFAKLCQKLEGIHCYMINTENTLAFCERMEYFKRYYQFLCEKYSSPYTAQKGLGKKNKLQEAGAFQRDIP